MGGITTPVPGPVYVAFVLFFVIICGHAFVLLMNSYSKAGPNEKNRLRYIFLSFIFAYLSGFLHFGAVYLGERALSHMTCA